MTSDSANSDSQTAACPRCGYDLRGVMKTWPDIGSCPLRGTCAECGLSFDWIDVINPSRIKPMWCVEYARGRVGWAMSVGRTLAMQCAPWLFWRRVRMHHEPRYRRIVGYLALLLVTVYLVLAFRQGVTAWAAYEQCNMAGSPMPRRTAPLPPPLPPPSDVINVWQAVGWSMLLPLSSTSPGSHLVCGRYWAAFSAPIDFQKETWNSGRVTLFPGHISKLQFLGLHATLWFTLLLFMPLTFALLPQTRRAAKVRWAHIVRIALYGAALTAPLLWWVALWQVPEARIVPVLILCSISLTWWGFACSRYLHLPRPWFVATVLTFMLLLIALAIQHNTLGTTYLSVIVS